MPDNHASKLKWIKKFNEPVNMNLLNKLRQPPKKYHGGLIRRIDPILDSQRFEEEQRVQRGAAIQEFQKAQAIAKAEKEAEDLRRHDEQINYLSELLKDSKNAVEQRDAIIRFMVEQMVNSEQSKEVKKKLLIDLLVPVATVSSGAGDLMQLVKEALESLS
ncbi:hypothetical protein [Exiguobacterium sp. s78]|uniref:hypothetical protein n=1 Tax=Exiguobacterium sp. s78 TaxID=2751197 RepID=UPI001BE821D2|nr:hypothetical protein [Exiguobacterium sp. s78]